MTPDPLTAADLVTREVRTATRDGAPTRVVIARRTYATDRADLWDAVTNPERLPRWFLPVSGELRPSGRYQLEGNAGGTIEECVEPDLLAVTWEFDGQVSWLRVTLSPGTGGTDLEVSHEAPVDPEFWQQFGPGAAGVGWDLALLGLGLHLDSGAPVDPAQAQSWPMSQQGVEFVRTAAGGWGEAGIAAGDDPSEARTAAENTVAFYTTPPEG